MTGNGVLNAFEPQRQFIQKSSAVIYDGRQRIAYGVVASADGYILSKASELEKKPSYDVRVDRKLFKNVKVVLVDPVWDVALLKVDAEDLGPVEYSESAAPAQGTWVVANGATTRLKRRLLAGIISAKSREIGAEGGAVLGVQLKNAENFLEIEEVTEGSGAEEADLKKGDLITAVDGEKVKTIEKLSELLNQKKAGETVSVSIRRGEKSMEITVKLSARGELFGEMSRNDQMSGDFSQRRSGFPKVIQHDILGNSHTMGGPVLGLDGKLLGMNIARANRAETFAIPAAELRKLATGMIAQARKQQPVSD